MADDEKKIIVDEDWKNQAQREKDTLKAEQEAKEHDDQKQGRELPPADILGLVNMLATQAFYALGAIQIEGQEDREPDFAMAKYNIDLLEVIQKKTKGNLEAEEEKVLSTTLDQARMIFVQLASATGQQQ